MVKCRFTWAYDFFSQPPIPVDGWAGTLHAGELLYMPGDWCLYFTVCDFKGGMIRHS